jgi:2-aminobenzoate-CoA ligase
MNVAGRKLAPEEIERAILAHSAVSECLVFSIPEDGDPRGDIVVAAVVSKNGEPIEDLRSHVLTQLASWKVPREWWFTDLQADQRGKLSRPQWREAYLKQHRNRPF